MKMPTAAFYAIIAAFGVNAF